MLRRLLKPRPSGIRTVLSAANRRPDVRPESLAACRSGMRLNGYDSYSGALPLIGRSIRMATLEVIR